MKLNILIELFSHEIEYQLNTFIKHLSYYCFVYAHHKVVLFLFCYILVLLLYLKYYTIASHDNIICKMNNIEGLN